MVRRSGEKLSGEELSGEKLAGEGQDQSTN